jgi:hypothetical protein
MKSLNNTIALGLLGIIVLLSSGCNMLSFPLYALASEQTKKIPAEYTGLPGKKICILVWADESVLFDFPALRIDTSNHARYFLRQHVKNIQVVDSAAVDKFQRNDYDADQLPAVSVGRKFKSDVVLFIQVVEFLTRPQGTPNLFQGRMSTECVLYDCTGELPVESPNRKLWSGKISVVYPEHPVGLMETNEINVRSTLLKLFGENLAKKFYEYSVSAEESK